MASIRTMLKCSKVQLSALQIKLEKLSSDKDIVNGKIKVITCIYYLDGRNWIDIAKVVDSLCALWADFELQCLCQFSTVQVF